MIAYLEEAATRPRFDDYWTRGGLFIWEEVRALPGGGDSAKVELAATYGLARSAAATAALQNLCRDADRFGDAARAACTAAGNALAQRGATWTLRTAGARLAQRTAGPQAQADAAAQLAKVQQRAYECAQAGRCRGHRVERCRRRRACARRRAVGSAVAARGGSWRGGRLRVVSARAVRSTAAPHVAWTVDGANAHPAMRQWPSGSFCIW